MSSSNPTKSDAAGNPPPAAKVESAWELRPEQYQRRLICKECREDPANIVEDYSTGDIICGSCGLVLDDHLIDTRPEWRVFAEDDNGPDPNRCGDGSSIFYNGNQLDTAISYDAKVKKGSKIRLTQKKVHKDVGNKALAAAYSDITAYCDSMGLNGTVLGTAKDYYKRAYDSKTVRNRDKVTVMASCIFLGCRHCGVPRTFNEIMSITKCNKKEITRTFKILAKFFQNQEVEKAAVSGAQPELHNATSSSGTVDGIIPRICSNLGLSHKCQETARTVAFRIKDQGIIGGRGPSTIAATAVFLASHLRGEPKTYKQIADVVGLVHTTIKGAYAKIYERRQELVDPEWGLDVLKLLPKA